MERERGEERPSCFETPEKRRRGWYVGDAVWKKGRTAGQSSGFACSGCIVVGEITTYFVAYIIYIIVLRFSGK